MGIKRQYEIKNYGGLKADLPSKLPYGDTYFTSDTNELYKYDESESAQLIAGSGGGVTDYDNLTNLPTLFDGEYSSLSNRPTLFDGEYASLSNAPSLFDGDYSSLTNQPTLFDETYDSLTGKPALFDGDYSSLTNAPSLFDGEYSSLANAPALFDGEYDSLANIPAQLGTEIVSGVPTVVNTAFGEQDFSNWPLSGNASGNNFSLIQIGA